MSACEFVATTVVSGFPAKADASRSVRRRARSLRAVMVNEHEF